MLFEITHLALVYCNFSGMAEMKKRKMVEKEISESESEEDLELDPELEKEGDEDEDKAEKIEEEEEEKEDKKGPKFMPAIYKTDLIEKRLERVKKVTLKILNKFSKKQLKKVPWLEQMTVSKLQFDHSF
jgi:hypothetical protein